MAEENERGSLISYAIMLIVISNAAKLIGSLFISTGLAFIGFSSTYWIATHALTIVFEIIALFITPMILSKVAPSFGGQSNDLNALKLYVFCMTPAWIGGILGIIPFLGWLGALAGGIFAIYLFWQHSADAMGVPEEKKVGYVVVAAVCIVVLYLIFGAITATIAGAMFGAAILTGGLHRF